MITIITDSNVEILYGESLVNQLKKQGFTVHVFSFAAGEASKTLEVANRIYGFLAKHHMTRSDGIIALGGRRRRRFSGVCCFYLYAGNPFFFKFQLV